MSLGSKEIEKLAKLAHLRIQPEQEQALIAQLNGIVHLADQLSQQDTTGIEPLAHPLAVIQEVALRLREDAVTETDRREQNMLNAPQQENGLFLVPKVID